LQEVKFNIKFCRCAIKAAVAHELLAFNSNPNAQKYHSSLTRQPPDLAKVEFATLSSLCQEYSQPAPEQHPQHAERATAAKETAAQAAADSRSDIRQDVTGNFQTASAVDEALHDAVRQQPAEDSVLEGHRETTTVVPVEAPHDSGAAVLHSAASACSDPASCDSQGVPSDRSGSVEEPHADDNADAHVSSRSRSFESKDRCHGDSNLKRLRQACEEGEGAPGAVQAYVNALFDDDVDEKPNPDDDADEQPSPDSDMDEQPNPDSDVVGALEREHDSGRAGHADVNDPCKQGEVCATVKRRRDRPKNTGTEKPVSGAASVWSEVREFVAMCLEPWLMCGAVHEEQYEVILDKCVSKVLNVHAGRKDAKFLQAEGAKINSLVSQYADFVTKQKSRKKPCC
jgi:hypothetical protein